MSSPRLRLAIASVRRGRRRVTRVQSDATPRDWSQPLAMGSGAFMGLVRPSRGSAGSTAVQSVARRKKIAPRIGPSCHDASPGRSSLGTDADALITRARGSPSCADPRVRALSARHHCSHRLCTRVRAPPRCTTTGTTRRPAALRRRHRSFDYLLRTSLHRRTLAAVGSLLVATSCLPSPPSAYQCAYSIEQSIVRRTRTLRRTTT